MIPKVSGLFAQTPSSNRRAPTGGEMASGIECGPADRAFFNEWLFRVSGLEAEFDALLATAGITPSESDMKQALQAIRSQRANYMGLAGGTANGLTLTPNPAFPDFAALIGVPLRFLVATANTAAVTVNVNGLGNKDLTRPNGSPLRIGDLVPGQLPMIAYNGTAFHLLTPGASDANPTSTVTFTSPGTSNWTVPNGIYKVFAEVIGAGGGGGGGSASSSGFGGSGGGAGGSASRWCDVTPGQVIAVTVGAGGVAGISPSTGAGAGGTSSFGSYCSATGGQGGVTASGAAVNGGVGSGTGALVFQGSDGKTSIIMVGPQPRGGDGGESRFGGGGSGSAIVATPGLSGKGYGAGAGGGGQSTNGGVGAPGLVIVRY